jgi:hypothetical protein
MSAFPHIKVHLSPLQEKKLSVGGAIQLKHCHLNKSATTSPLSMTNFNIKSKAYFTPEFEL